MIKIGFIGVGNMGAALARAASKHNGALLLICDSNVQLAERVATVCP